MNITPVPIYLYVIGCIAGWFMFMGVFCIKRYFSFAFAVFVIMILAMMIGSVAFGQTNFYYARGDFNIEIAPQVSSGNFFDHKAKITYGNSTEVKYWQTAWSASGLELGSYDLSPANDQRVGLIDHVTVLQYVRWVPFDSGNVVFQRFGLDRWAIEGKTGAETFFRDTSKDIQIGVQLDFAINRFCGLEADYTQHIRINDAYNGGSCRFGFFLRF